MNLRSKRVQDAYCEATAQKLLCEMTSNETSPTSYQYFVNHILTRNQVPINEKCNIKKLSLIRNHSLGNRIPLH